MKDVFRKSTFCVITVLFLSFFVLTASALCGDDIVPPSEALNLTLEDSMLVALRNNKDIQTQEEEIAYARAGIQDAFSKFLPFLSVTAGEDPWSLYSVLSGILTVHESETHGDMMH